MKRYAIVVEKAATNYGGYVPDLPGCVATGATVEETERLLREAIELQSGGNEGRRHSHPRTIERGGLPGIGGLRLTVVGGAFPRAD